ncbi:hypothetical protein VPNG_04825 [Cytospora leucostoma]|uniref:C2H2-type domain-containing protein n=1 Tax=Cytospora leucostoma TaxID=1230097 RepID=A0A423XBC6_9PEZI|nr:hypothetical protein VPNG_04825 [Cytospora leucostoma]
MPNWYYECGSCDREFPAGLHARENHCRSTGHARPRFECDSCCRWFNSEKARWQHMSDTNHFAYECSQCNETYPTTEEVTEHEIDDHYYCADCDRFFMNRNNIRMHLNSSVHRGSSTICPLCKTSFTTASGIVHHLERGACPRTGIRDRNDLYELVRSKDPKGIISKKLIGWHDEPTYKATKRAWNGNGYECYFCHKQFGQLAGLNQHLQSPVHQQALYHCPNRNCGKDFTTLAATINHLESETCGFMRFDKVQRGIGDMVTGRRMIGY